MDSTKPEGPKKFLGIELTLRPTPRKEKKKTTKIDIQLGGRPSVNFLPKKVREQKDVQVARRGIFGMTAVTVIVCFLAALAANVISFSGNIILENAQLRLSFVKAEQAKFQNIIELERRIRFIESARKVATSAQINYEDLLLALNRVLPQDAEYLSIQASPAESTETNSNLVGQQLATKLDISMTLSNYVSLQAYLDSLPDIQGFSDVRLTSVSATGSGISTSLVLFLGTSIFERPYLESIEIGQASAAGEPETEPGQNTDGLFDPSETLKVSSVFFAGDSASLSDEAISTLESLVDQIPENATELQVTIKGYVYPTTDTSKDEALSASRAAAVKKELELRGINAEFITVGIPTPLNASPTSRRADIEITYKLAEAGTN